MKISAERLTGEGEKTTPCIRNEKMPLKKNKPLPYDRLLCSESIKAIN
jgi:hypothetical protein